MTSVTDARRGLLARVTPSQSTFDTIFGLVYAGLMTNVALALANAPLVFFLFAVADPIAAWPFFLLLSVTVAPSLAGAFAVFAAMRDDDGALQTVAPFAEFVRGYRAGFRRAAVTGVVALALLGVLVADVLFVAGGADASLAALVVPFLVVLSALVVLLAVTTVIGGVLLPGARLGVLVRAAFYVVVRRWYFSLVALLLLGIIVVAALLQPILGIVLAPALLLYAVWANTHFAFVRAAEAR